MEIKLLNNKFQQVAVLLASMEYLSFELHVTTREGYCTDEGHWFEYRIEETGFQPLILTLDRVSYSFATTSAREEFVWLSKKKFFKRLNKMLDYGEASKRFVLKQEKVYKLELQ